MINYILKVVKGEKWTSKQYKFFFFLLAFVFYAKSVSNEFSIDDRLVTNGHAFVQKGFEGIYDILSNPYQSDELTTGEFRPVSQITYAIEYELFNVNPKFSHLVNTLLYAWLCMLCFTFFIKLTHHDKTVFPIVFVGIVLFVIHPIHTEVVSSLKNRESIFSMIFGILTLLSFLKYLELKKWIHVFLIFVYFVFALLSKVDSVVFALLLVAVAVYKNVDWKFSLTLFISLISFFLIRTSYNNFVAPNAGRTDFIYENPLFGEVTLLEKIGFALQTFYEYISLLIFPYPLRFYYGFNTVKIPSITDFSVWASVIILLSLLFIFIKNLKKNPLLSFSVFWFIISISIFLQVIETVTGIIGERHAFISSLGFSVSIAFLLKFIYSKIKIEEFSKFKVALLFLSAVLTTSFIFNQRRIADWKTNDSIFEADMPKLVKSAYANFEYGNTLNRRADRCTDSICFNLNLKASINAYQQAIAIFPDFTFSYYNIGMVYLRLKDNIQANSYFRKAWDIDSNFRSTNYFLGLHKMDTGDTLAAINYYKRELKNRPENVRAIERLFDICIAQGKNEEVLKVFEEIKEKKAKNSRVYFGLSKLYEMKGDSINAQEMLRYSTSKQTQNQIDFQW